MSERQGLNVSIKELLDLVGKLYREQEELNKELGIKDFKIVDYDRKFIINIVNFENLSDTWKLETTK